MNRHCKRIAVVVASYLGFTRAFYLPGFAPKEFVEGGKVDLKVNKLTSPKTQLPYSYYKLPYCVPEKIQDSVENLGETLMGDLIENSPYVVEMKKNETCKLLCKKILSPKDKDTFKTMIEDEYVVNWIMDNLPAATRYREYGADADKSFVYQDGFLVGFVQEGHYYVHNHVTLDLKYHANAEKYDGFRVVGFEVEPHTIVQSTREDHSAPGGYVATCGAEMHSQGQPTPFELDSHDEIVYTYDVTWTYSEVRWASRWDSYLKMTGSQIHWFAIINSLLILLLLSGMVAMIMLRTLHRDITKYNEIATTEDAREETGWKLVHGDVFRKPQFSTIYCVSLGSGMQILGMSVVTIVFAVLGFLSPARRGGLLQSMMLFFTFMGCIAGYVAARFSKVFDADGTKWKLTTMMTALFYPSIFFAVFFILNLFIWGAGSTGAVPFTTMFAVVVLWFGVSVPLVILGAHTGFKKPPIELPVRVCVIPRVMPEQLWYQQPLVVALVGGLLPFGAVFTELFFIMSSIWQHQFYYMFGFVALVLIILIITCSEISIALTYFQLTSEDYRWWWPSFVSSGSSGLYVLVYSMVYLDSRMHMTKFVSLLLYFGYMALASLMFSLLTGAIGSISAFIFVRAIYGSIKVD